MRAHDVWMLALLIGCSADDTGTNDAQADVTTNDASADVTNEAAADVAVSDSTIPDVANEAEASSPCPGCVVLSSSGTQPHGIFVDSTNVYWTYEGSGTVNQAHLDGTSPVTLAQNQDHPIAVAARSGFVYFMTYSVTGTIARVPVGGGTLVNLGDAPAARNLVVDASFIWWTREPDDLQRAPITGIPDGGAPLLESSHPETEGLAVDTAHVYWADRLDGYVFTSSLDFGGATQLAVGDTPFNVAVDATSIYWTEASSTPNTGKVMKASKTDGSNPVTIATAQASPRGLAIDATSVYWANFTGGTVMKAPLAGGSATVIGSGLGSPVELAIDATSIYWTEETGNRVMKAPK